MYVVCSMWHVIAKEIDENVAAIMRNWQHCWILWKNFKIFKKNVEFL